MMSMWALAIIALATLAADARVRVAESGIICDTVGTGAAEVSGRRGSITGGKSVGIKTVTGSHRRCCRRHCVGILCEKICSAKIMCLWCSMQDLEWV